MLTNGNANEARRIYAERYPQRHIPCHTTFSRLDQCIRDTGEFHVNKRDSGANRNVRNVNYEDQVLQHFENNPQTNSHAIAHALNTSHSSVWRV